MKLHRLEMTAFGPYPDKVEVNFDLLDEAGVYLLTGPTGAGKTTVLDAISYALFGEIPRSRQAAKVVSDHRRIETTPRVMLEATIGGSRIRIERIPGHERPKKAGTGTTEQSHSVLVEAHVDGEWKSLGDHWTECNEDLVRRVGMNAGQFSQVVMLPQGDFAKFLKADVKSRKDLLEKLFPGMDLAWMEEWFLKRARADREARSTKLREISDRFEQVRTIAVELAEEGEDPLPEVTEAKPALDWTERKEQVLAERFAQKEAARVKAGKAADQADRELKALGDQATAIEKKLKAEAALDELDGKTAWREALATEIKAAGNAAPVRQLASGALEQEEAAREASRSSTDLEAGLKANPLTGRLDSEELPEAEAEFRAEATTILNFERNDLPRRRQLTGQVKELEGQLVSLADKSPESPYGKASAAVEDAKAREGEAKRRLVDIREARTRGMAAELARDLEAGKPCAVCGSPEHPSPAHGEGPQFTKAQEDDAQSVLDQAGERVSEAVSELGRVEAELGERKVKIESGLMAGREELAKLEAQERELTAGAASVGDRREELERSADLIRDLLAARSSLDERTKTAEKARSKAETEAGAKGFGSVKEAVEASREESVLERLKADLTRHDQKLAIVRNQLDELAEVDTTVELDLEPARTQAAAAGTARDEATGQAGVAGGALETFHQVTSGIPGLFEDLEPLREASAVSDELDRMTKGENERRMKLSIYVLATRLRQVIDAANFHLRKMSDQRYELVYSGDLIGHGATSGLGIEVHDAYTAENRPTSSLSGGESFWASLSLALGLAEVVAAEAGGKQIETLFIDEGFGTLDPESLGNVIDVIDSLREGGRSVGLVSHVEEMKIRIPTQIRVSPGREGSTLEVVL